MSMVSLVATLEPSTREVEVEGFEGVATLRAMAATPLADVKPVDEGISLQRTYYVLREGGKVPLVSGDSVNQGPSKHSTGDVSQPEW